MMAAVGAGRLEVVRHLVTQEMRMRMMMMAMMVMLMRKVTRLMRMSRRVKWSGIL